MVQASSLARRCLIPVLAAALLGGIAAVVPAAPAAAATAITLSASTNLVQGQTVLVSGTGYPANTQVGIIQCADGAATINSCAFNYNTATTDGDGSFSNAPFAVSQVISTLGIGVLNCAVDPCAIAVGTVSDQGNVALAPITMTNTLGPPSVTFDPSGPFVIDATNRMTAAADMTCHTNGTIIVRFRVEQPGTGEFLPPGVIVDCADGATIHVISDESDSAGVLAAGPMDVVVETDSGAYPVKTAASVTLQTQAEAGAALLAALQGPSGAQVFAQLITDLRFRLLHNPLFAHTFPSRSSRRSPLPTSHDERERREAFRRIRPSSGPSVPSDRQRAVLPTSLRHGPSPFGRCSPGGLGRSTHAARQTVGMSAQ